MDPIKMKLLNELLKHLDGSQGSDLKSMVEKSKMPALGLGTDDDSDEDDMPPGMAGKPKGIKIESIEVMKKPKSGIDSELDRKLGNVKGPDAIEAEDHPLSLGSSDGDEDEMNDDELKALLDKYMGK